MLRTRHCRHSRGHPSAASRHGAAGVGVEALEARVVLSTVTWDWGGGDRLWSNPLNWSGDVVPTVDDDVTIDLGTGIDPEMMVADLPVIRVKSLTLNETLVVNRGTSFNVTQSFDIMSEGALRINGLVNWAVGVWDGDLAVRVQPGGFLNVGSTLTPGQGEVTLESDLLNWGRLNVNGGDMVLNGTITNQVGKAFNLATPGEVHGGGAIINHGLMRRGGELAGTTTIAVNLTNTDRLFLLRGTLSIGRDDFPTAFTNSGRVAALRTDSMIRYFADSTHTPARLLGDGAHQFMGGVHTFEGESFLGLNTGFFDGAEFIAVGGVGATGHVTFHSATITLAGPLTLRRFQYQSFNAEKEVFLFDTLVQGTGTLYIEANTVIQGSTFNVDTHTEVLQIGDTDPDAPGMSIGPGATFFSHEWVNFLSGRIDMAPDATFDKIHNPFYIYGSHIGGANPGEGTLILRNGQTVRRGAVDGPATTTINANVDFNLGPTGGSNSLHVSAGHVVIAGELSSLRLDPVTGFMTLYDLDLYTVDNASIRLPHDVESIGEGSGVSARAGFTNLPQLSTLREVRGGLSLSGSGNRTYACESDVIVNYGSISKGAASGLATVTTPIDNRAGGRIFVTTGGLEFTGFLDENNQFVNRGTIDVSVSGTLIIHADQGQTQGTLVNLGRFTNRGIATVLGSFENAAGARLELNAAAGPKILTVSRDMIQGGVLYMFVNYAGSPWTTLPVTAGSYFGQYATVTLSHAGPAWSYLPNGALQVTY